MQGFPSPSESEGVSGEEETVEDMVLLEGLESGPGGVDVKFYCTTIKVNVTVRTKEVFKGEPNYAYLDPRPSPDPETGSRW